MRGKAVIFDFDDTLVYTNVMYDKLRGVLFDQMAALGMIGREQWADYLNRADMEQIERAGHLTPRAFPLAMRRTAEHFARKSGRELPESELDRFEQIGWSFYRQPVTQMEGAEELLRGLQGRLPLCLLTVGDPLYQRPRIERSGLAAYFERIRIVREKNAQVFTDLVGELGLEPRQVWMVGNSIRSDVNPALSAGLNVVFFHASTWAYDLVEPIGPYHDINHLAELRELIGL